MRSRKIRIISVMMAVLIMSLGIVGCQNKIKDLNETVAILNDKEISIGVANFLTKYRQASYETYYGSLFGDDMWNQDIYGDGRTLAQSTKEDIMSSIEEMYLLDEHKGEYNVELTDADNTKILKAAEDFMAANSKEAIEKTSASTEIIEEVLRLFTVRAKVYDAIVAKADTNVSDEEAAQRTFSYLRFNLTGKTDESGNTVEYTDDEKNKIREDAKAYLERAKAGETLDDLAKEADTMVLKYSYGSDESENGTMDKTVIEAADKLNEGELSEVIESEDVVYIIRLDSTFDAEATASKKEEIINKLTIATIKYTDLLPYRKTDYIFDPVKFSSIDGKTGPYILYTIVRIKSILNKVDIDSKMTNICNDEMRNVLVKMTEISNALTNAYNERTLNYIAEMLYDICSLFNKFYNNCNIVNEQNMDNKASYVAFIKIVYNYIKNLLNILAIDEVEKM